tara:strand:+ start:800 stop:1069 length:270 start_codon:yes stop_codon:yes gene_type:complete
MFDPGELTVKEAVKRLAGLSDDALSEVYDAELDGKGRKSLLDEITAKRDALREDAAPAAVAAAPAPKRVLIRRPARPGSAAATYVKIVK